MKLELSGKEFTLRADFRAFAAAKSEAGIKLEDIGNDPVDVCTLVYFMARSGAKHAEVPFKYKLDDFLGLMQVADIPKLTAAINELMGSGEEKKS